MSEEAKKVNLNQQQRKQCYKARDAFYECSIKNGSKEGDAATECEELKKLFHKSCPPSWVKYFNRQRVYEQYKQKLAKDGAQFEDS